MILGSALDLVKFKEAVEDYWWPRIMSDELGVELTENDAPEIIPEPLTRDDLKPYIHCYNMATDETDAGKDDHKYRFRRARGIDIARGTLALTPLGPDDSDDEDGADSQTPFRNSVALIRSGPKMVVQYKNQGGRLAGDYAGVFLSDPEAEEYLHLSEPPSHDDWHPDAPRLREKSPDGDGSDLVKSILDTIRNQTRRYQRELNPPPERTIMGGTDALKRILAGVMTGAGLGRRIPPPPSADPFDIDIRESRTNTPTHSTISARIEARLKSDAPEESEDAAMRVRPTVAMDDNLVRGETIGLSKVTVDGAERTAGGGSDIEIEISKSRTVSVEIESDKFSRDLYADLEVSIRIIKPEPNEANDD